MIKLLSLRAAKFKQLDDVGIAFPQRGSVLIQGLNEAGKSTLFESVYFALFGKGLVTEENSGKLDDLINYQAPRALVKLAFTTDDATFIVARSLNRGKANSAVLEVEYAGGKQETITNLSAINRRIVEELRLDGEALLNSCFVEQKKLEKLEGMGAQQRRDTLLRLLNLDKLGELEAQYKPSSADEFRIEQLRSHLRLAEVQRDLPAAEQRLREIERQQRVIHALGLQRQLADETQTIERAEQTRGTLQRAVDDFHLQLSNLDRLKEQRDLARAAGESLRSISDESAEIDALLRQIALTQDQAERGPALEVEVQRLEDEANRLAELARSRRAAELLRSWLQIREVAAIAQQSETELEHMRQQTAALETTSAQRQQELATCKRNALGAAGIAVLLVAAGLTLGFLWNRPAFALLALSAILGAWSWQQFRKLQGLTAAVADVRSQVAAIHTEVHRREGEQALAQRTGQDPSRLREIELELASFQQPVPESVSEAHETLRDLDIAVTSDSAPQTEAAVREQAAAARAARQTAVEARVRIDELEQSRAVRQRRLEDRRGELESVWSQLAEQRPDVAQEVEACRRLWRELGDELTALDEPGLRRHGAEADQQLGATEQTLRMARQRMAQLEAERADLAVDEASLVAAEQTLQAAVEPGEAFPLDSVAQQLQQEQRDVLGRIASLRDQRASLEQQLELQGVAVDHDEAVRTLAEFEEQTAVHKQAYRIVTLTRKNIVGKVLPSTVRNMRLLLPLLTSDRYRDADIDPETYKIRVWDETARAMKAKDIFSGGTRDQFSLALRLAFALATLPEELGTAPGFIFLDEPLSSFDQQRGSALVDLLTRGPIADSFEQIFVISHNRSFDESLFDFHVQLENGRIADSDLPALEVETPADGQMNLLLESAPSPAAAGRD